MKYLKTIISTLLLFQLIGCASFTNNLPSNDFNKITQNDIEKINGKYRIYPIKDSTKSKNIYKDLTGVWWRAKKNNLELNNNSNYYVEIKVINSSELNLIVFENESEIARKKIKGKLKNGMFYINQKMSISGLPYIFGTFVVDKKRIGLRKNNLIIDKINHEFGAVFIIFTAGFKYLEFQEYERID
ncbi:hypothetical protein [Flavobacterium luteum]|uniref:Uncharacterized protein n=1 Tax=Flavobacterium luteum TaxID=2026654 RepID=A0A7J5AKX4_9FLAO|nr:hypothetical protein [Flavobacterium luteum]KAB1158098.1 hypothetical protein F6464_03180 [Flavobacterium luteum]